MSATAMAGLPFSMATAATGADGTLGFQPASGVDTVPLTAVSTGVCSDPRGTNLQLQVVGKGFPPGTNVTPNLAAHIYPVDQSTGGYDVPLQDTLSHFAEQQSPPAVLSGRYDFTLVCKQPWGRGVFNTYKGSLWFSSATEYHALTTAARADTRSASPSPTTTPRPARHVVVPPAGLSLTGPAVVVSPTQTGKPSPIRPPKAHASTGREGRSSTEPRQSAPVPSTSPLAAPRLTLTGSPATSSASASEGDITTTPQPNFASDRPADGAVGKGWLVALLVGVVAAVTALGFVLRRRVSRYGRP